MTISEYKMYVNKLKKIYILKKIITFLINKYWRIIYKLKYGIPFFDKNNLNKIINPINYLEGAKSVAIIGKGASIFENNPKSVIEKCDCRILLSRVDVENLETYIGKKFEVQITPQVADRDSIVQVLPKKLIKKYGIELLIVNLEKKDERFKIYHNFFHDRVNVIGYKPTAKEMDFDIDVYKYSARGSLTIASTILRILCNVSTVEKIVFAGVDAFHYGYSQKQKEDGKVFYNINTGGTNKLETHGKPFIKYMIDIVKKKNKYKCLEVYFPKILKNYINFPNLKSFKFY